ncbi:MAG: serine/threonine-protein kinase, partial [bacterium]
MDPLQIRSRRRYAVIGEHGRGGLGRVSRSLDRELGRDVAIKEMLSSGDASEARFLREVLITARLEHPGIVPVYEAGRWPDGTPFYAMKLVSGRSLRELIAERQTVDKRLGLLHHVIAIADAIAYAHARNIIHRDLKPANVVVGEFGETIVVDWGLAKDLSATEESAIGGIPSPASDGDLTATGAVVGTRAYMAPEQERGEQVDQRADVFAIGAMLWELCSLHKVPPNDLRQRHRMLRREGIDADLVVIIDKALDRSRERRYGDAAALATDLKAFKSGARIAARNYSLLAMLIHWTRRHRTIAISVVLAAAVAIVAGLVYVRNIGIERNRADIALDELVLKHAESLLISDASTAVGVLRDYEGEQIDRAQQIRAEAAARGVAFLRATPHTEEVRWITTGPNGAIISVGADGAIVETLLEGRSRTLARNVSKIAMVVESRSRNLLAYTCDPTGLCLFDLGNLRAISLSSTLLGGTVNG